MVFALVNGHIAWNTSAKLKGVFRTTLDNATWRMHVAEHMLNWKDWIDEIKSPTALPIVIENLLAKCKTYIKNRTSMYLVFSLWFRSKYLEKSWNLHH